MIKEGTLRVLVPGYVINTVGLVVVPEHDEGIGVNAEQRKCTCMLWIVEMNYAQFPHRR